MKPEQIAQQLSQEQAQLPDGVQLPGEHQLAARFGVTRAAVRSALSILESRHLIRRVRGAGTFTNRPVDHLISAAALQTVESLYESLRMAGHQPVRA